MNLIFEGCALSELSNDKMSKANRLELAWIEKISFPVYSCAFALFINNLYLLTSAFSVGIYKETFYGSQHFADWSWSKIIVEYKLKLKPKFRVFKQNFCCKLKYGNQDNKIWYVDINRQHWKNLITIVFLFLLQFNPDSFYCR